MLPKNRCNFGVKNKMGTKFHKIYYGVQWPQAPPSSLAPPPFHELDQHRTSGTSITWAQLNSHFTSLTVIAIAQAWQLSRELIELDIHCMILMSWTSIAWAQRAQQSSHQLNKLDSHCSSSQPSHELTAIKWAQRAWQLSHKLYKLDRPGTSLTDMQELHELDSHHKAWTAIAQAIQCQQP